MSSFLLKKKSYESFKRVLIIAEIGSNHDNNFIKCKKLISSAKQAGCDAVKFQLFRADKLVKTNSPAYKVLKKYELSEEWIKKISKFCKKIKILFGCSPFDLDAIKILKKYKCDFIKIASPEIKNLPLINQASKSNIPIIISTGDSSLKEILRAKKQIQQKNYQKTAFLHCISEYPAKVKNLNLNNINYLKKKLPKFCIGFSDHSLSEDTPVNAVATGAAIIEKHFTLFKKSKGPDHSFALEPDQLKKMVLKINNFIQSYGKHEKLRLKDENTIYISMVAAKLLKKNKKLSLSDINFKRTTKPGMDTINLKKILNKKIKKNIMKDKELYLKNFKI